MDKEKEVEEFSNALAKSNRAVYVRGDIFRCGRCRLPTYEERAERLIKEGYGNVKQAVKEFAEKLKTYAKENHGIQRDIVTVEEINNLFKELYGNES